MGDLFGLTKFTESIAPLANTMKVQELAALAQVASVLQDSASADHRRTSAHLFEVLNLRVRTEVLMLPPEKEVKP